MRILQVHNAYNLRGGEDSVVEEERGILEMNGHTVIQYARSNTEFENYGSLDLLKLSTQLRGSSKTRREFTELLKVQQPDICHVHNVFPLITPIVYEICYEVGVPIVQTLHNFRLACTNSYFFRDGHVCEECLGGSLFHGVKHKCYRNSYIQTFLLADTIQHHWKKATWTNKVAAYLCFTEFAKNKFIEIGLPADKLQIKPNFVSSSDRSFTTEDFFLFIGRAERPKGIFDLIEVAKRNPLQRFIVIGACEDASMFYEVSNIEYLGEKTRSQTLDYISKCRTVLFPSIWYEGMPMVILEAFSKGKGVVCRDLGAMSSLIEHGHNGWKYNSISEFSELINLAASNESECQRVGMNAAKEFELKYTSEVGYAGLLNVYKKVIEDRG